MHSDVFVLLISDSNYRRQGGQHRTNPIMNLREGDHPYMFSSKAGAPTHPDWYHNLLAHPEVTVELGDERLDAIAKPITSEARDQIYGRWAERFPQLREYQEKTTRRIPVLELEPRKA